MQKLRSSLFLLATLLPPLHAQGTFMSGPARAVDSLKSVLNQVRRKPGLTLVVIEAADGSWAAPFRSLSQAAGVADFNLEPMVLASGSQAALELARRESWPKGGHWAVFDPGSRVLAEGAALPSAEGLATSLQGTGVPSRLASLRAFLAARPGHVEGLVQLVGELRAVAERRTRAFLGTVPAPGSAAPGWMMGTEDGYRFETGQPAQPEPAAKELPEGLDAEIWGEYARNLERLLASEGWAVPKFPSMYRASLRPEMPVFSPLARSSRTALEAHRKVLPRLESALAAYPTSAFLWEAWLGCALPLDASLLDLLKRLVPPPGLSPQAWPPPHVRRTALLEARRQKAWPTVAALALDHWDNLQDLAEGQAAYRKQAPKGRALPDLPNWLHEGEWSGLAEPLLEAFLREGRTGEAERLMQAWGDLEGWKGAWAAATALAEQTGHSSLAAAWKQKAP